MYEEEHVTIANKTSRASKAIGQNAIVPRYVGKHLEQYNKDEITMLDYGAGKSAIHARSFVEKGWQCLAHEFGNNIDVRYHCGLALANTYDIVYASNVFNVQASFNMFNTTLNQINMVLKKGGILFANYPLTPRKSTMTVKDITSFLKVFFETVEVVNNNKNAPVFKCKK